MVDSAGDARWEVPRRSGGDQTEQISNECLAVPQVEIERNARETPSRTEDREMECVGEYFEELMESEMRGLISRCCLGRSRWRQYVGSVRNMHKHISASYLG